MSDQAPLFEVPLYLEPNPMVHLCGRGPEGETCRHCRHVIANPTRSRRTFYKCRKRGAPTNGPGTDHRLKWRACGRFEVDD
jgi:hypothetical protein